VMPPEGLAASSFRDPSGFVFWRQGRVYRQVNRSYREHYDLLIASGLYRELSAAGWLIRHEDAPAELAIGPDAYKVIQPFRLPFISYPFEWSFSQLQDAALLTLDIQKTALAHGMSLKDASAYNIQFSEGKPLFIDTLSFEKYAEGRPWVAYRQFCQHFLAPLALMARCDVRFGQLGRVFMDGIPLDLASRLLPVRTRFAFSLLSHIHLHARSQKHFQDKALPPSRRSFSRFSFLALVDSLRSSVARLRWQPQGTEWAEYYQNTNYSDGAVNCKLKWLDESLNALNPQQVWDIGANTGVFSRLASARRIPTVSLDIDPAAVAKNSRQCRRENDRFLMPLLGDITNPSPAIGWQNRERMSLLERGPADTVLALALVHHLAIGNNLPLPKIAALFAALCRTLIIEFVPKDDSQVQRLLASREDIFPDYHEQGFAAAFGRYFSIERSETIDQSGRRLYMMKNKSSPAAGPPPRE
jgi:hypothetical protein